MTALRIWHALTYLGDSLVLLPCAALLFVWLIAAPATRRSGWWWLTAVLTVSAGVVLSKLVYMVFGWRPAGWNFTGLSGHSALSLLFWPSAIALVTGRNRTGVRAAAVAVGTCLALAIATSSWVLGDHSLLEVVLGALWGALISTILVLLTWRHVAEALKLRKWMFASALLWVIVAFGHEFPSTRVLGWIALHASARTVIHMPRDQGSKARSSKTAANDPHTNSPKAYTHTPL